MLDGPLQGSPVESIQRPNATVEAVLLSCLTHDDDMTSTCTLRHNQAMAAFVHHDQKSEEWLCQASSVSKEFQNSRHVESRQEHIYRDTPAKWLYSWRSMPVSQS